MLIKLGSFDAFLYEMNESSRKTYRSVPRIEVLIVKVDRYLGENVCHIDSIEGYKNSLFYEHNFST